MKKQLQMRNYSEGLRLKNEVSAHRLGYVRSIEDKKDEKRREHLDRIQSERQKKIQTQLYEQEDNFELFKWNKNDRRRRFEKQKALKDAEAEKQQIALQDRIDTDRTNLDTKRDHQKMMNLMKQEMRKLKSED